MIFLYLTASAAACDGDVGSSEEVRRIRWCLPRMKLRTVWKNANARIRWRVSPALGDAIVSLLTFRARVRIRRTGPVSVLVDNTVLAHAVTHETAWVSTGTTEWGPNRVETGCSARIPVRRADANSREYRSISFLPGIAHLARLGLISLVTSGELELERFRQPSGRFSGYGYFDHSVFSGLEIKRVDHLPDMMMDPEWMNLPSIKDQQLRRLELNGDPLYRGLATELGPKNSLDAWHIRTAEVYGQFCFLTMDFSLCKNVIAREKREPFKSLRAKVMTPEQLGEYLGILPVNPRVLSYQDASYPVRPDLSWSDAKRHRPKKR